MSVSTDRRLGVNSGLAFKVPVMCATTGNITLNGLQTIDGVTLFDQDRVLVWQQTSQLENGIYNASTGNWTRALDFDGEFDVTEGALVFVRAGDTQEKFFYFVSSQDPNIPNENPIVFTNLPLVGTNTYVSNFITNVAGPQNVPYVETPTAPDRTLIGKCLGISAGITIPANVFNTPGDIFWVLNKTASPLTLTEGSGLTLIPAGTSTAHGNRTLAPNGISPLYFINTTTCYASGHVT